MIAGPEFATEEGKTTFLFVKALYGLKLASYRSYMAKKLSNIGFHSSMADPNVWLQAATKGLGEKNLEYILVYVDDILAISF
jgi:hypothetical protein